MKIKDEIFYRENMNYVPKFPHHFPNIVPMKSFSWHRKMETVLQIIRKENQAADVSNHKIRKATQSGHDKIRTRKNQHI